MVAEYVAHCGDADAVHELNKYTSRVIITTQCMVIHYLSALSVCMSIPALATSLQVYTMIFSYCYSLHGIL